MIAIQFGSVCENEIFREKSAEMWENMVIRKDLLYSASEGQERIAIIVRSKFFICHTNRHLSSFPFGLLFVVLAITRHSFLFSYDFHLICWLASNQITQKHCRRKNHWRWQEIVKRVNTRIEAKIYLTKKKIFMQKKESHDTCSLYFLETLRHTFWNRINVCSFWALFSLPSSNAFIPEPNWFKNIQIEW